MRLSQSDVEVLSKLAGIVLLILGLVKVSVWMAQDALMVWWNNKVPETDFQPEETYHDTYFVIGDLSLDAALLLGGCVLILAKRAIAKLCLATASSD